ncbi:hypothetical protein AB6A40_003636 [Gnathostoma spinigerum]|uniref:Exonuclease domain-containing protein n=1 Tax=Gnathostoma spinigerum TaxID=75299 RepID=A0ABD6EK30_9BILA
MIGRSGLFSEIICPHDDDCNRPHCHFWHSKDEASCIQGVSYPAYTASEVPSSSGLSREPFMGYIGYVESDSSTSYNSAMYAPVDHPLQEPPFLSAPYQPTPPSTSTSNSQTPGITAIKKQLSKPSKRNLSPECVLPKAKVPVEMAVDDILDPKNQKDASSTSNQMEKNKPNRGKNLNDYAKSVADIDSRIEELKRRLEQEEKSKEKIVNEFKSTLHLPKSGEYFPTTKPVLEHRVRTKSYSSRSASSYTGGYTPTPISLLKSSQQTENADETSEVEKTKSQVVEDLKSDEKPSSTKNRGESSSDVLIETNDDDDFCEVIKVVRPKQHDDEKTDSKKKKRLSIEDLFDSDDDKEKPVAKKSRDDAGEQRPVKSHYKPLTEAQVAKVKQRVLQSSSNQRTISFSQPIKVARRVPTAAEQFAVRYEKLREEKERILAKANGNRSEIEKPKGIGQESDYRQGSTAASVGKGDTRTAHTIKAASSEKIKFRPLEPYSICKVTYAMRVRYVELFYNECRKVSSSDQEALVWAQNEEKIIKDKAVSKSRYTCAAVAFLRKVREMITDPKPKTSKDEPVIISDKKGQTISIGPRRSVPLSKQTLAESEFYDSLRQKYIMSEEELRKNGYPLWEDKSKTRVLIVSSERDATKKHFVEKDDLKRMCCRCGKEFRLTPEGEYASKEECVHHWGRAYKTKIRGNWESRYNCCSSDLSVSGCAVADFHVTDTALISELSAFRETPSPTGSADPRSRKVYALDCEMVYTAWGLTLARISVVDINDDLVLDIVIKPACKVIDCNSRFSGLTMDDLNSSSYTFNEAIDKLFTLINSETILIGHSLESDLKSMRLVHYNIVDTSVVFPHRLGPPYKRALKTITSEILQWIIQEDVTGHDSKEDSSACMKLMLHKVKHD